MAADRRTMMMVAQLTKAINTPNEYVKFYMNDDNCNEWFILLSNFDGDEDEFKGGEYLVQMKAPVKFPFEPPEFYFYTDNGVYETHKKICISIGEFHKADYRAALGMAGFANQLWNGMIGWRSLGHGISIISTDIKTKKTLAEKSLKFNRSKHGDIIAKIEDFYTEYTKKWDRTTMPIPMQVRLGLIKEPVDDLANNLSKIKINGKEEE